MIPGRLETVAVIGNGIIGHGIAQIFAAAGNRVVMIGRSQDSLDRAMKKIAASLDDFAAHGLIEGPRNTPFSHEFRPRCGSRMRQRLNSSSKR